MTDTEQAYSRGKNSVYREIFGIIARGADDKIMQTTSELLAERNETISILREICGKYGDNNWEDNLHLADILDKHLMRHLEEK